MGTALLEFMKNLVAKIEKIIKNEELGYASISEFVKDAIRRRLEEIEKTK